MISNYIKMALRVMGRKKFFTAITLFGISFTLAILMILVSFLETEVGQTKPLTDKESIVVLPTLELRQMYYDTIYTYDTSYVNGEMVLDSSYTVDEAGQSNSNSELAMTYLQRHFDDLPNVRLKTFFSDANVFNAYVNNSKVVMSTVYADAGFWDVFDFEFTEGFGFSQSAIDQAEPVAVITTELADQYFGKEENVLGEFVELDGQDLKVIGVVEPAGVSLLSFGIVVPHTLETTVNRQEEVGFGSYIAVFKGDGAAGAARIKDDIKFVNSTLEVHPSYQEYFNEVILRPSTYHEIYADALLDMDYNDGAGTSLGVMKWILLGLISFFILLPTLNLINLNVSRILERSSEIGVRKSFGATQGTILSQFIIENVIQTILGGVIGIALAMLGIKLINDAKMLGDVVLKLNMRFFLFSLLICLLFGLLSGLLPAYRMSKVHIVNALKKNKI